MIDFLLVRIQRIKDQFVLEFYEIEVRLSKPVINYLVPFTRGQSDEVIVTGPILLMNIFVTGHHTNHVTHPSLLGGVKHDAVVPNVYLELNIVI